MIPVDKCTFEEDSGQYVIYSTFFLTDAARPRVNPYSYEGADWRQSRIGELA